MAIVRNIITRVGADINPLQKNMLIAQNSLERFNQSAGASIRNFNTRMSAQMQSLSLTMAKAQANTELANSRIRGLGSASQLAATKLTGLKSQLAIQQKMVAQLEQEFHNAVMAVNSDVTATRKLEIELIKAKKLEQDLKNEIVSGNKAFKQYGISSKSASGGLLQLSGSMKFIAATAVISAFTAIAKSSISAAMKTVESENLFQVSMGNMAGAARQWSDELQASLGLNAYQVRANVGMFYNMTTSMGLAQNSAYKLSTDITKLAYDMSSFYNIGYEDMFTKLSAGITGETEPLRRLGIIVTENALQQQAYAMGIKKTVTTMSEQEKVMLRYNAIMAQTKNAQGDLARTISSPANQLRLFQTQIELASINLGNMFMPLVEQVSPLLINFAKGLVAITSTLAQFSQALFGSDSAQAQNASSAANAANAQKDLGNSIKGAGAKAKKALASFDQVNTLQESMASSAADATDAASTTPTPTKSDNSNGISQGILDLAKKFRETLQPATDALNDLKKTVSEFAKSVGPDLLTISGYLKPIFSLSVQGAANAINNFTKAVSGLLSGDFKFLEGLLKTVAGILKGDWKQAWDGTKISVDGAKLAMKGAWEVTQWLVNPIGQITKLVLEHTGAGDKLKGLWSWIKTNAPFVSTAFSILTNPIGTVIGKLNEHFKIGDKIKNLWNWIKDNAGPTFNVLPTIVKTAWSLVTDSIKNSINTVITSINKFIRGLNNIKITVPEVNIPIIGKVGGVTIGFPKIPEIPKLARGGIVSTPTLAEIGHGPEAIIPLENTSFVDKMASAIGAAVTNALGGINGKSDKPGSFILKIGENEFARLTINAINNLQRQSGETLLEV